MKGQKIAVRNTGVQIIERPFFSTARLRAREPGLRADGARDCVRCRHHRPRAGGALIDSYSREQISCSTFRSSDPLPAARDARTASNAPSGGQGVRGSFSRISCSVSLLVADRHGLHRHGAGGGLVAANSSLVCRNRYIADRFYFRLQAGR